MSHGWQTHRRPAHTGQRISSSRAQPNLLLTVGESTSTSPGTLALASSPAVLSDFKDSCLKSVEKPTCSSYLFFNFHVGCCLPSSEPGLAFNLLEPSDTIGVRPLPMRPFFTTTLPTTKLHGYDLTQPLDFSQPSTFVSSRNRLTYFIYY